MIAFTSDWLYTPAQNKQIFDALLLAGKDASYLEINDSHGHDSFLINSESFLKALDVFLKPNGSESSVIEEEGFRKLKIGMKSKKRQISVPLMNGLIPKIGFLIWVAEEVCFEHLWETKQVHGLGVDRELGKSISCVARKVPIYQRKS